MDRYVDSLRSISLVILLPKTPAEPVVTYDSEDDPVIATAVVGQAEILCTKDRHFLDEEVQSYCANYGIRIMDDVALLHFLREF